MKRGEEMKDNDASKAWRAACQLWCKEGKLYMGQEVKTSDV